MEVKIEEMEETSKKEKTEEKTDKRSTSKQKRERTGETKNQQEETNKKPKKHSLWARIRDTFAFFLTRKQKNHVMRLLYFIQASVSEMLEDWDKPEYVENYKLKPPRKPTREKLQRIINKLVLEGHITHSHYNHEAKEFVYCNSQYLFVMDSYLKTESGRGVDD